MPAEIKAISCLLCLNANDPADMVDVDLVHHAIPAAHRAKVCRRCAEVIALAAVNSDPPIIPQSVWESSIKQMLENPEFMEAVSHGGTTDGPDPASDSSGSDLAPGADRRDASAEAGDSLVLADQPSGEGPREDSEQPGADAGGSGVPEGATTDVDHHTRKSRRRV